MSVKTGIKAWLRARGLPAQEAALWAQFIVSSVEILHSAERELLDEGEWNKQFASVIGRRNIQEPDITSALGKLMRKIRCNADAGSPLLKIEVGYETPPDETDRCGIDSRKIDLRTERFFGNGKQMTLAMEAKPLSADGDIENKYLADGGIGCFRKSDSPYTRGPVGCMVGYAYKRKCSYWTRRIRKRIQAKAEFDAKIGYAPVGARRMALVSDVARPDVSREAITLLHLVLNFADRMV